MQRRSCNPVSRTRYAGVTDGGRAIGECRATGGSVAIPIDDYLTNIAPTEAGKLFEDHGYLQSEGYSRAEAQEFY